MLDPSHPIAELLQEDRRYSFEAYVFVFEALSYAQNVLEMGAESASEPIGETQQPDTGQPDTGQPDTGQPDTGQPDPELPADEEAEERHVSGQELCEAIRRFALEQFGYMSQTVLSNWGIRSTGDFGEIVFNLIRIGQMRKTPGDSREDFDDVYDFDTAFKQEFKITPPE